MLKRKVTTPKSASRSSSHRAVKPAKPVKAKTPPVRRPFVISSKATSNKTANPEPAKLKNGPPPAPEVKMSTKLPANGQSAGASPSYTSTVDLTETIKTLLHLSQEHGYVTYDDINDVLPDNLSPDDLDALLTKLRGLDVEIVMDQAEAERSERTKQPESQQAEEEDDSRLEILDDPVRMYMN